MQFATKIIRFLNILALHTYAYLDDGCCYFSERSGYILNIERLCNKSIAYEETVLFNSRNLHAKNIVIMVFILKYILKMFRFGYHLFI